MSTKNTNVVLAIEIDTDMLGVMQKLIFVIKRLNPSKEVELRIINESLMITVDGQFAVNAIKAEEPKLWHVIGAAWLSQYIS